MQQEKNTESTETPLSDAIHFKSSPIGRKGAKTLNKSVLPPATLGKDL